MSRILRTTGFVLVSIFILGFIIYSNTLRSSWHFDDLGYIVHNPGIRSLGDLDAIWNILSAPSRLVTFISFALNYHFHQYDLLGYHIVNILIHVINSCLVYLMASLLFSTPRLKGRISNERVRWISFGAALIFLTHPLQTQAVTYICQRFASLATLFYLLSISFYLMARTKKRWKSGFFILAAVSALLGMLTKQITLTIPFTILMIEFLFISNGKEKSFLRRIDLKILIAALLFVLVIPMFYSFRVIDILSASTTSGSYRGEHINSKVYFLTQSRVLWTYLRLVFFPVEQNLLYDFKISNSVFELPTMIAFFGLFGLFVIGIRNIKNKPVISFGIFYFFLTVLVESSIIPIRHVIFEHRMYLPLSGISISVSYILFESFKKSKHFVVAVIIVAATLSYLTFQRNRVWKDGLTLWQDVKHKSPNKTRAYINMGIAYSEEGEYSLAVKEFNHAIALNPRSYVSYSNRGLLYNRRKMYELALADFNQAIEINDTTTEIFKNRADTYRFMGEYGLALKDYNQAIELNPHQDLALSNRGVVQAHLGDIKAAFSDYNAAIKLNPHLAEAYINRGNLHGRARQYDKALSDFSMAIKINPKIADIYNNRGNAYRRLKQYEKALKDYNKAIELNPGFLEAYNNRGVIYKLLDKPNLALEDYNKSIALDPAYATAYNNRGNLYLKLNQPLKALEDYRRILTLSPNSYNVYYQIGNIYLKLQEFSNALEYFNRYMEHNDTNGYAYLQRSVAYFYLKKYKLAQKDIKKAMMLKISVDSNYIKQVEEKVK